MFARGLEGWLAAVVLGLGLVACIDGGTTVQSIVVPPDNTLRPVATVSAQTNVTPQAGSNVAANLPFPNDQPISTELASPTTPISPTTTTVPLSTATATVEQLLVGPSEIVQPSLITYSAGGRPITGYRLGAGATSVVVIGGIHGGYEWNAILLAERLLEHFMENPDQIPAGVNLTLIPNANPDGLFAVAGTDGPFAPADIAADSVTGRFNANGVDLNRNWDCQWTATAQWRDRQVSGGPFVFSEPETRGLRDYLLSLDPIVVIFLHSAANAVFIAGCGEPHQPSYEPAYIYGQAAGYPVREYFDLYPITGDAGDWLTTQGIASFSVELVSHESLDLEQNLAGLGALLAYYGRPPATGPVALPVPIEVTP